MVCINIVFVFKKSRLNTIRVTKIMGMVLVAFKTYVRDIEEDNEVCMFK